MRDELVYPLGEVLDSSDFLLRETILNDLQRKFVHNIHHVAEDMLQLIVATPPELLTIERAREVFSYETREILSSMIGYAEVLQSEEEGELNRTQQQYMEHIHINATELLDVITNLIDQ